MLTSIRSLSAATLATGLVFVATPALANENTQDNQDTQVTVIDTETVEQSVEDRAVEAVDANAENFLGLGEITLSGNTALVSEYRFRGVDLSGGDIAIQGGFDLTTGAGFYVGTWASSLDEDTVGFGSTEVDVYGGWSGDLTEGLTADIGVIGYFYPDAAAIVGDTDYVEFYGSLGFEFGPAELTLGGAYAPDQDSLGGTDNIYVYTDVGIGIPTTPVTVTGHVGYTDGFLTFTNDSKAFDWSIGAEATVFGPVSVGVSYVGAEGDIPVGQYDFVDDAVVFSVSASF